MTDPRIEAAVSEWMRQINSLSIEKTGVPAKWTDAGIVYNIRKAMTAAIAAADAVDWIPSSSPPKTEDRVLILLKDGDQCTGSFQNGSWYETLDGHGYEWDGNLWDDVAFWRYLPSPPTTPEPTP